MHKKATYDKAIQDKAILVWDEESHAHRDTGSLARSASLGTSLLRFSSSIDSARVWLVASEPGLVVEPPADKPSVRCGFYEKSDSYLSGFFALRGEDLEGSIEHVVGSPQLLYGGDLEVRYLEGVGGQRLGTVFLVWNNPKFHTDAGHGKDVSEIIEEYNVWARGLAEKGLLIDAHKLEFDGGRVLGNGSWSSTLFAGRSQQLRGIVTASVDEPLATLPDLQAISRAGGTTEVRVTSDACSAGALR